LTEMTAVPGCGDELGPCGTVGVTLAPDPEPLDDPPELSELCSSLSCCENGSLLAKRLKEASCPFKAAAVSEAAAASVGVAAAGCSAPLSEGAASEGVPAGGAAVVAVASDACGLGGVFIIFMTRGTWKPITARNTTPRTAATTFCFFCFALSASTLFDIYGAPVADAPLGGVSVGVGVVVELVVVSVGVVTGGLGTGTGAGLPAA
jgi:hypothetical protein